jgi:hypothetical protein
MIEFTNLSISPEGDLLLIEASVPNESYYTDVYIDSITIDTPDKYANSGPSTTPVYSYNVPEGENTKTVRLVLKPLDTLLASFNGMILVYAKARGVPAADTPCGKDNITTLGVAINLYPYYQKGMQFIKELASTCSISSNFINYILGIKGIELAMKTCNYAEAIALFNKLFNGQEGNINGGSYGCKCSQ